MSQLICKNLLVGYEGKAILDPLNFEIHAGGYLCVVGENGAGKSTLMKTLLGLQQPISGQIEMGDGLRRNEIGYLPQQTIVQRDFPASVQEIVLSGCQSRCGLRPFYSREESSLRRMPCTKCRSGRWQNAVTGSFPAVSSSASCWRAPSALPGKCCFWTSLFPALTQK